MQPKFVQLHSIFVVSAHQGDFAWLMFLVATPIHPNIKALLPNHHRRLWVDCCIFSKSLRNSFVPSLHGQCNDLVIHYLVIYCGSFSNYPTISKHHSWLSHVPVPCMSLFFLYTVKEGTWLWSNYCYGSYNIILVIHCIFVHGIFVPCKSLKHLEPFLMHPTLWPHYNLYEVFN